MDTHSPNLTGVTRAQPETWPEPELPARLLLLAVAWLVAGMAAGITTVVCVAMVAALHNGAVAAGHGSWQVAKPVYGLLGLVVTDIVLLLAAWGRGQIVGQGDAMAGLCGGPISRPRLLVVFAAAQCVTTIGWTLLLGQFLKPAHPAVIDLLKNTGALGPVMQVATLLCIVGFAPLWEELFFRGWLWTGLRRHWGTLPVMVATALPWLLAHLSDGLTRPLFLVPGAIFLSMARQYCGGVRASLTLHALNNLAVMGVLAFAVPVAYP